MQDVVSFASAMARKPRSRGPQVHPTGPLTTVDDSFKERLRAQMTLKGWTQADLAEQISVSPASITNMFKPGERQIRFYPKLLEKLPDLEAVERRLTRLLPKMTAEKQQLLLQVAESLTTKP